MILLACRKSNIYVLVDTTTSLSPAPIYIAHTTVGKQYNADHDADIISSQPRRKLSPFMKCWKDGCNFSYYIH